MSLPPPETGYGEDGVASSPGGGVSDNTPKTEVFGEGEDDEESEEEEDELEYQGFDAQVAQQVGQIVRTLSRRQTNATEATEYDLAKYLTHMSQVPGVAPFNAENEPEIDPKLNPSLPDFEAKYWVKNLRKLYDSDPDYYKPSKLGVAYRNLRCSGIASDSDYQPTVTNGIWKAMTTLYRSIKKPPQLAYFDILKPMDGFVRPGEVTVVLGRPGSGCTTLLKTLASHTYGFEVAPESHITYDGISPQDINTIYRGDVIYSAETDVHFPHLTVGDTLDFAARLRTPKNRGEIDRETYAKHMASVYMAMYGLLHTRNTQVGNDFIRGVSGGERKRVSIAEASLSGANLQCWDNATRGLDAATALEFIRALKTSATILEATPLIAIYQCSQDAYDLFDNVIVLYEGYQIFFGKATRARAYFEEMGYICPQRQTTADFLTSLTNPAERIVKPGYENKVPRTAKEFDEYWKASADYDLLIRRIDSHINHTDGNTNAIAYEESHKARQADHLPHKSPYVVSFYMQVRYIMHRNWLRTKGDPSITIFSVASQVIMALLLSSVFYNLQPNTNSFFYRGSVLFFGLLFNAFSSLLEIIALFEARNIVEKQKQYALYRPSADALASIITELPVKVGMSLGFNITLYFMANLRRTAGNFFIYLLFCFTCTLVMSHLFRAIGAVSTSLAGAMTPANVLLMAMVIFTGFVIPTPYMLGWSRWINYINPVGYIFESLMVNEFHNREFECLTFLPLGPEYANVPMNQRVCLVAGAKPGSSVVNGSDYIAISFKYYHAHKWRNFGIAVGFVIFFLAIYLILTETNKGSMQKGEITLFLSGSLKKQKKQEKLLRSKGDIEDGAPHEPISHKEKIESSKGDSSSSESISNGKSEREIFHWRDLTYQVKIKAEDRVILNHVDGWVKPGQVTALMGASGAGKTTLLNCLSERVTSGIITDGVRLVNGKPLDNSFQRSIGYAQQQDIHLAASTVREALRFSAYLRQPSHVSKKEKDDYVEYVIDLLEMYEYADALVGVAGEGLNVEQRKRLTIGVELAAKPKLLVFLDEPTSGLDSQTAWAVCKLLRKLADHGQAILCTIHQPSAILMKEFDRLLFLQKGGKTVYFGDLGENSLVLINYFEKYGAHPCPKEANPAEWMLEVIGAAPGSHANQDYHEVWRNSTEYQDVQAELNRMETQLGAIPKEADEQSQKTYAAPLWKQFGIVTWRAIVQNWRTPTYVYSKFFLVVSSMIFNGFAFFKAGTSVQGLQNQLFSVFMCLIPYSTYVQQMLPYFVRQREIYEVREAPSRTFSWAIFILGQVAAEMPFQVVSGTFSFFCWYYPVGVYRNAEPTNAVNERGAMVWMYFVAFYIYTGTISQWMMSFNELIENAGNLANFLFTMCLLFCGAMAPKASLPGFWIFMYRANPFTYWIQGVLVGSLANTNVVCSKDELIAFPAPSGQTCQEYLAAYIKTNSGYLVDPLSTTTCEFCRLADTNSYLGSLSAFYSQRWRNWGIFICFIAVNIIGTVLCYYLARVPKGTRQKKA
ncbi:Multidrug resistance protein [Scheffersomyces spartinae]|uniref:Multidrug resistance protein n=1 Tax=Scheffersomyces spartinae TaxID=45513 RepID=A0A9P7VD04_9ASCO|nr:Multidrug resistance protein [Scheffersomyces spartinae]KAG7195696.1 Multidrug resistance protein [Scheffersomyces spartinae]